MNTSKPCIYNTRIFFKKKKPTHTTENSQEVAEGHGTYEL